MARYKPYDPNQSRLVPVTLSEHIYEGSLEEAIHKIVEEQIDLTKLDSLYSNDDTGRPAIHPKVLLKVILLGYARGISGSRPIERDCRGKKKVNVQWLLSCMVHNIEKIAHYGIA